MDIDWAPVHAEAIKAIKSVLGTAWTAASKGGVELASLIKVAAEIEAKKNEMKPGEYEELLEEVKQTLKDALAAYEAIGIAAAENAVARVVKVITNAVPGIVGLA